MMMSSELLLSVQISSALKFHGRGDNRAVQAVKVTAPVESVGKEPSARTYSYTFCMERVSNDARSEAKRIEAKRSTVSPPNSVEDSLCSALA